MAPLSYEETMVLALVFSSAGWSAQFIMAALCVRTLIWSGRGFKAMRDINRPMLVVSCTMFLFATTDFVLGVIRQIKAVKRCGNVNQEFGDVNEVFHYISFFIQALIGDGILVYRCWVVYNRSILAILGPVVLWIACCTVAVIMTIWTADTTGDLTSAPPRYQIAMRIFLVASIAQNILSAGLVVYRIYSVDRSTAQAFREGSRPRFLRTIIRAVVESGALYIAVAIAVLIAFSLDSPGVYVAGEFEPQIISFAFNLLITRVHIRTERALTTERQTTHSIPLRIPTRSNDASTDDRTKQIIDFTQSSGDGII